MGSKGFLVVLSGPSGAGKNTLADTALQHWGDAVRQVTTYTTRAPRANETGGVDYHFVNKAEFNGLKKQNFFLESALVHGNHYGSPRGEILKRIAGGEIILLVLDIQGGIAVKKQHPESVLVFVMPSRFEELGSRLGQRGVTGDNFELRMENAKKEIQAAKKYDYIVINDELPAAVEEFKAIVEAERCRAHRRQDALAGQPAPDQSNARKRTKVKAR